MTLTWQWRYLTRNSYYTLFLVDDIMSYWQIISSRLHFRLKGTYALDSRALKHR